MTSREKKLANRARQQNTTNVASERQIIQQPKSEMALGRLNFICMGVAGLMIVAGFLLMLGPSSTVENFEPDIFSTRRIVVGPLIAFLGFVAMAIAIIVMPRKK